MRSITLAFGISLLSLSNAAAQYSSSVKECDSALVMSTYHLQSQDRFDATLAETVTESEYKRIKEKHGGGVNVLIYGVPVGANYNQFKDNIRSRKYSSSRTQSLSYSQAVNILQTGLDRVAADAYKECLAVLKQRSGKPMMNVRSATESEITVLISYNAAPQQTTTLPIRWTGLAQTSDGTRLPDRLLHGVDTIILLRRPAQQQQIVLNSDLGGDSIVLEPLPPVRGGAECNRNLYPYNFDGRGCGRFDIQGTLAVVSLDGGRTQVVVPKDIPSYNAKVGTWFAGDFDGDGLTDLAHVARAVPGLAPRVHIHFAIGGGIFAAPTTSIFRDISSGYDANLGEWTVSYDASSGRDALVHNPRLSDDRRHWWTSHDRSNSLSMTTR